jgi:serine protease Do
VVSAWLGVSTLTVNQTVKTQYGLSVDYGALVVQVVSGSPADSAGLKSDDVIVKLDEAEIRDSQGLGTAIQSYSPGEKVRISYVRGQSNLTTEVTLGQRAST